ncbi:MAG: sulfite exporter TauE/SafE family protein, partial [Anaerolineae bacterium]|nr:sulfite exporter TauE/SafE family protein [Anaerolineae bacterium]
MVRVWAAFIAGLTTGGLGCLALQGGLLASSLAQRVEDGALKPGQAKQASGKGVARTILLFLGAKVVAHAVLGLLLGALGSILKLNALTRALLQLGIGIFMIGNALRMLDVHPFFRFFAFEPPAWVTRYIRRTSRREATSGLPLFLGVLTVLIPCGVTQTMMVAAMGAGDPLTGGAMMAAFTLGTTPVFFAIAYSAMRIGATLEHAFLRVVAVVVLILGLVAVDSGLNLIGSPASVSRLVHALRDNPSATGAGVTPDETPGLLDAAATAPAEAAAVSRTATASPAGVATTPAESPTVLAEPEVQTLFVRAQHDGYVPPRQHAVAGTPTMVVFATEMA